MGRENREQSVSSLFKKNRRCYHCAFEENPLPDDISSWLWYECPRIEPPSPSTRGQKQAINPEAADLSNLFCGSPMGGARTKYTAEIGRFEQRQPPSQSFGSGLLLTNQVLYAESDMRWQFNSHWPHRNQGKLTEAMMNFPGCLPPKACRGSCRPTGVNWRPEVLRSGVRGRCASSFRWRLWRADAPTQNPV